MFADSGASLRGIVTEQSLQNVLDHVSARRWPADLVAMTGDLSQDESAASYQRFKTLFATLGLPVHCIPGNHDIRATMQDELNAEPFHYCSAVHLQNWLIVGVDSCVTGEAGGRLTDEELARLLTVLEESSADHALVCLHHPPTPVGSTWLDGVGLKNGAEFLRAVSTQGKTRAALFGHIHQPFEDSFEDIKIVGTPSTCRQFMVGSDKFALDDNPPAYRRVTLHPDGGVDTELMWVEAD